MAFIEHDKLDREHFGTKKLHLNKKGNVAFPKNNLKVLNSCPANLESSFNILRETNFLSDDSSHKDESISNTSSSFKSCNSDVMRS